MLLKFRFVLSILLFSLVWLILSSCRPPNFFSGRRPSFFPEENGKASVEFIKYYYYYKPPLPPCDPGPVLYDYNLRNEKGQVIDVHVKSSDNIVPNGRTIVSEFSLSKKRPKEFIFSFRPPICIPSYVEAFNKSILKYYWSMFENLPLNATNLPTSKFVGY
ncbi:MAG: hypothetical protein ACE5HI_10660, partial [bacterium]